MEYSRKVHSEEELTIRLRTGERPHEFLFGPENTKIQIRVECRLGAIRSI